MTEAKVFIVEDEPILVEQLRIDLEELGYWIVGTADNGETAVNKIISIQPDLIIMDVNINGDMSGIEVGLRLKQLDYEGGIIFLTSLDDDSVFNEARGVFPFDYLIKPVRERKLKRTLDLYFANQESKNSIKTDVVVLKGKNELHKIVVEEIKVIEVQDKFCLISLEKRMEAIKIRKGLLDLLEQLNSTALIKVHRSYVVNKKYIESYDITMSQVKLRDIVVPVSRSFKENLLKQMK